MVELSVVLVALGLIAMATVAFWRTTGQQRVSVVEADILARAQQSVLGFVYTHYRLPCPASGGNGVEDCGPAAMPHQAGKLPWRTLQLPDAAAAKLKYGVYRAAQSNAWQDMDLAIAKDRMRPLMALGIIPSAAEMQLGNITLTDFCLAINLAATAPVNNSALTILDASAPVVAPQSVAMVIAAPGLLDSDNDGDVFDGLNHTASNSSPAFEASNKSRSDSYDDRVLAIGFNTLFGQLQCSTALSAIDHSHFNAAISAALMKRALSDNVFQMQVKAVLAGASVATAVALEAEAIANLAGASAALINASTFTVITIGSTAGLIAAAVASIVANTAVSITAAAKLVVTIATTVVAAEQVTKAQGLANNSADLSSQVDANARGSDALGY